MTLKEAKILADNGNVKAMLALARFYDQQTDNEEASDLASHYYRCAAEAGDSSAIMLLAQTSHTVARTMMGTTESFRLLLPCFEDSYKWTKALLEHCNQLSIHGEAGENVYEFYLDSIVWLSAAYNMDDNYAGIKRITAGVAHPIAKAIRGMALYELANTNAEIASAFDLLKNAMHPSFWDEKYSSPDTLELLKVTIGMLLSTLYRVQDKNFDAAYKVLATMLNHVKDTELRQILRNNIACYKKTLFGRYKYIK